MTAGFARPSPVVPMPSPKVLRAAVGVIVDVPVAEGHDGAPYAVTPDVVRCRCGDDHQVVPTAYGRRAQCDLLGVRWTSLDVDTVVGRDDSIRVWVAEPYGTMATRSTRDEEPRK